MYVVHVIYRILPEKLEDFLDAVKKNAATSAAGDYGCRQFDVSVALDGTNDVMLYEVYDSDDSFAAHKTQDHYHSFIELTNPWTTEKIVRFFEQ